MNYIICIPSVDYEFLFFCINTFKYGGKITNKQRKIAIFAISFKNYQDFKMGHIKIIRGYDDRFVYQRSK